MTDTYELPTPPNPKVRRHLVECAVFDPSPGSCDCGSPPKVYDALELESYARLAVKQERERAAAIVQAEIDRAESLMALEEGGRPVFNAEQTEAGICALRTVAAAIRKGSPS
jgi:hypothetical protein